MGGLVVTLKLCERRSRSLGLSVTQNKCLTHQTPVRVVFKLLSITAVLGPGRWSLRRASLRCMRSRLSLVLRSAGRLRGDRHLTYAESGRNTTPTTVNGRADHRDERVGAARALDGLLGTSKLRRTRDKSARRLRHVAQERTVFVSRGRATTDRASVAAAMNDGHLIVARILGRSLHSRRSLLLGLSRCRRPVLVPGWLLRLSLRRLLLLLRRLRRGRLTPSALLRVGTLRLPLGSRTVPSGVTLSRRLSPALLLLLLLRRLLRSLALLVSRLLRLWLLRLLLRLLLPRLRLLRRTLLPPLRRTLLPLLGRTLLLLLLRWALLLVLVLLLRWRRTLLLLGRRPLVRLRLLLLLGRLTPRRGALTPTVGVRWLQRVLRGALRRALRWRRMAVRDTAVLTPSHARLRRGLLMSLSWSHRTLARCERAVSNVRRRCAVLFRIDGLLQGSYGTRTGGQPRVVGVERPGVGVAIDGLLRLVLLLSRWRSLPRQVLGGSKLWLLRSVLTSRALSADLFDFVGPLLGGLGKEAIGVEEVIVA